MNDAPKNPRSQAQSERDGSGERVVYVLPEQSLASADDEVSLRELWDILWRGKWIVIAITALFTGSSVWFALTSEEWYRAETVLAPADQRSTSRLDGELGGLAALAGVSVGGGDTFEAVATLRSRELARKFIEDNGLVMVFFGEQWDESKGAWMSDDPSLWPDARSATKYFHEKVLSVNHDRRTGLLTLAVEWKNPDVAAIWARDFVRLANQTVRDRALREAERNVAYLQGGLAQTSVLTLQQSIGRLLESELQKLMLARGNEEFAFKVIDEATPPRERVRPKRGLIVVVGTLAGGLLAVFLVFLIHVLRGEFGFRSRSVAIGA